MNFPAHLTFTRALRALVLALAAVSALAAPRAVRADEPARDALSPAGILADAGEALAAGEHQRAADLARGVLANPQVERLDRTEAWRLYGLAAFFLGLFDDAEEAFLEYLKLDVDGRLDPALVPPEAIVFFEGVRARHAAELRRYRPPAVRRRHRILNFLPPAGQFQNGHRTKGWILAGVGSLALATNITTYAILRRWCDQSTGVCTSGGESRTGEARTLRTLNLATGAVFLAAFAYGILDGFLHYRPSRVLVERSATLEVVPAPEGAHVGLRVRF